MFDKETTNSLIAQLSSLNEIANANDLMQQIVNMVQTRDSEIVCVSIFLADSKREFVNMCAGTGIAGQRMLQRGRKSILGSTPPVSPGAAACHNEIQLIDYRFSYASPNTGHLEVFFPLQVKNDVIGVIEISIGALDKSFDKDIKIDDMKEFQRFTDVAAQKIYEIHQHK
jgi:hypothetical protein